MGDILPAVCAWRKHQPEQTPRPRGSTLLVQHNSAARSFCRRLLNDPCSPDSQIVPAHCHALANMCLILPALSQHGTRPTPVQACRHSKHPSGATSRGTSPLREAAWLVQQPRQELNPRGSRVEYTWWCSTTAAYGRVHGGGRMARASSCTRDKPASTHAASCQCFF